MIIDVLVLIVLGLICYALWIKGDRDVYQTSVEALAKEVSALHDENVRLSAAQPRSRLTLVPSKAQSLPKRFTGAQLRRVAEQVNAADTASLQERPNSEIL